MNEENRNRVEIDVGDKIWIIDMVLGEDQKVPVAVLDVRLVLGEPAYLVETQSGQRKLVGKAQIRGAEQME